MSHRKRPELKVLHGTSQPVRETPAIEEMTADALPKHVVAPPYLNAVGRKEWNRLVKELRQHGLLERTDLTSLAMCCQCYQEYVTCITEIEKLGGIATYTSGASSQEVPLISAKNKAVENYKKFISEFGLSPGARSRLGIRPKAKEKSDFQKYLESRRNSQNIG